MSKTGLNDSCAEIVISAPPTETPAVKSSASKVTARTLTLRAFLVPICVVTKITSTPPSVKVSPGLPFPESHAVTCKLNSPLEPASPHICAASPSVVVIVSCSTPGGKVILILCPPISPPRRAPKPFQ